MTERKPKPPQYQIEDTPLLGRDHFALMLRGIRFATGMSAGELAACLEGVYGYGYTATTIFHRESGRRSMTIDGAIDHLNACGYELIVRKKV